MSTHKNKTTVLKMFLIFSTLFNSVLVSAEITINEIEFADGIINNPSIDNVHYSYRNYAIVSGVVDGSFDSVTWQCVSGCGNSGTINTPNSPNPWQTATIFLNAGTNIVTFTAHHSSDITLNETFNLTLYRTIPEGIQISFPYELNFDNGPSSLEARYSASDGATVTHQDLLCWDESCAKFIPSVVDNSYASLGGFSFPIDTRLVYVRYLINFGADYVTNLNTRHKHILIHRGTEISGDRGMTYIWTNLIGDFAMGACKNTDCRFDGKTRPDGTEAYIVGEHLQEWVNIETMFDLYSHTIQVFVTTQDGTLNNELVAEQTLDPVSSTFDYWTRISIIGAFIDRGTTASEGMYWLIDELVIDDEPIGPPAGFIQTTTDIIFANGFE